jgi:hypothetical protein
MAGPCEMTYRKTPYGNAPSVGRSLLLGFSAMILFVSSARGQDAIFLGSDHVACTVSGSNLVSCGAPEVTIVDFKHNTLISCIAGGDVMGVGRWVQVPNTEWLQAEKTGGMSFCNRRSYVAPASARGAIRFLQRSFNSTIKGSQASISWSYDSATQILGYCLVPEITGWSTEPLCDTVKVVDQ